MNTFVRAIIRDSHKNKYLVLNEKREQRNVWNFPGGKVEAFENSLSACLREIYEETSLKIYDCELLFQKEFYEGEKKWVGYYFWVNKVIGELKAREGKCNDYNFITLSEIVENDNIYIFSASSYIERIIYGGL